MFFSVQLDMNRNRNLKISCRILVQSEIMIFHDFYEFLTTAKNEIS